VKRRLGITPLQYRQSQVQTGRRQDSPSRDEHSSLHPSIDDDNGDGGNLQ
jgi:hypothetical protein